jgi:hypothetical protein
MVSQKYPCMIEEKRGKIFPIRPFSKNLTGLTKQTVSGREVPYLIGLLRSHS